MSTYPIRDSWWSRPGWSEFGDYRKHGSHNGLDLYTRRGMVIWAHAPGRVARKAESAAGDFGWWIRVVYDDGFEVLYAHMLAPSPRTIGTRVDAQTRLGQVGDTGNARGNDWLWGSPIAGVALQHVHTEVRSDGGRGARINPRFYFDSLIQAGSPGTPISPKGEQLMRIIQAHGSDARAAIGPGFGFIFTSWDDYVLFCNVYGIDPNAEVTPIGNTVSPATARRWFDRIVEIHRAGSAPASIPATVNTAPIIAAIVAAIQAQNVTVDAAAIARAVEAALKDEFEQIPKQVNDDAARRLKE